VGVCDNAAERAYTDLDETFDRKGQSREQPSANVTLKSPLTTNSQSEELMLRSHV